MHREKSRLLKSAGTFLVVLVPTACGASAGERASGGGLACGSELVCDPATQYCSVSLGGPVGVPATYACAGVPDACPSPATCECVGGMRIGCECTVSDGLISVICRAP
jgi:hypothetical protein